MRRRIPLYLAWLPCVFCAVLWPASYSWQVDAICRALGLVELTHGAAYVGGAAVAGGPSTLSVRPALASPHVENWAGVAVNRWLPVRALAVTLGPWSDSPSSVVYVAPLWLLALVMGVPPVWLTRRWLRTAGACPTCGYDLRATPARCPECGKSPAREASRPPG